MVRARLHIICGNCGCKDMFSYEIDPKGRDVSDDQFEPVVWIRCGNCATLHDLSDYMPETKPKAAEQEKPLNEQDSPL